MRGVTEEISFEQHFGHVTRAVVGQARAREQSGGQFEQIRGAI
jgi:hypothetical protein